MSIALAGGVWTKFEHLSASVVYFVNMMKNTRKSKTTPSKVESAKPAVAMPSKTETVHTKPAAVAPVPPRTEFAAKPVPAAPIASAAKPAAPGASIALELVKPDARQVYVAGSFNEWKPERAPLMAAGNGRWVGNLSVKPGRYEYLFVVDGQWVPDPNAKESVLNPFGGRNSVVTVSA